MPESLTQDLENKLWGYATHLQKKENPDTPIPFIADLKSKADKHFTHFIVKTIMGEAYYEDTYNPLTAIRGNFIVIYKKSITDTVEVMRSVANSLPIYKQEKIFTPLLNNSELNRLKIIQLHERIKDDYYVLNKGIEVSPIANG